MSVYGFTKNRTSQSTPFKPVLAALFSNTSDSNVASGDCSGVSSVQFTTNTQTLKNTQILPVDMPRNTKPKTNPQDHSQKVLQHLPKWCQVVLTLEKEVQQDSKRR